MRQTPPIAIPVALDRSAGAPLPVQLAEALRSLARDAVLRPGEPVPSSRSFAAHLGVSRGTVVAAYDQLLAEGWLATRPGGATTVNPLLPRLTAHVTPRVQGDGPPAELPPRIDLRPGRPFQDAVTGADWRAAWRRAADEPVSAAVPPLGWPHLRAEVAEHLRRMRGVVTDPARVAITAGGREGLALVLQASGVRTVGVEDPGFQSLRRVLDHRGLAVHSLPTDEHGLVTDALPEVTAPDAVIVTPSHQYPLGGTLPIDRRLALLDWASRHGVLIIEDDYDSELRYTSEPLPALAALDSGRVTLLGTFSKTLTPALATGFVVLPPDLVSAAAALRHDLGQPVGLVAQRALAAYLQSGALARHTQRMRRLYRRRRHLVVEALSGLDGVRVSPMDGGLHAVLHLQDDETPVVETLAARGVAVASLTGYWASSSARAHGIVLGYAGVPEAQLREALLLVRGAVGGRSAAD